MFHLLLVDTLGGLCKPGTFQCLSCRYPLKWVLLQHSIYQNFQILRTIVPNVIVKIYCKTSDALNCLSFWISLERVSTREQNPQNYSAAPNVTLFRIQSLKNLRGHVCQRADFSCVFVIVRKFEFECFPKVNDLYFDVLFPWLWVDFFDKHDVLELDVAMSDFDRMQVN